jgi:hypothetical protein
LPSNITRFKPSAIFAPYRQKFSASRELLPFIARASSLDAHFPIKTLHNQQTACTVIAGIASQCG